MRDERLLGHSEIYHKYNFSGPDRVHLISLTLFRWIRKPCFSQEKFCKLTRDILIFKMQVPVFHLINIGLTNANAGIMPFWIFIFQDLY